MWFPRTRSGRANPGFIVFTIVVFNIVVLTIAGPVRRARVSIARWAADIYSFSTNQSISKESTVLFFFELNLLKA